MVCIIPCSLLQMSSSLLVETSCSTTNSYNKSIVMMWLYLKYYKKSIPFFSSGVSISDVGVLLSIKIKFFKIIKMYI